MKRQECILRLALSRNAMPAPYIICKWHRGMRLLKITSREAFSPPYMTSAREARSSRPFTFSRNASSCVHSGISRQRRRGTNRQKKNERCVYGSRLWRSALASVGSEQSMWGDATRTYPGTIQAGVQVDSSLPEIPLKNLQGSYYNRYLVHEERT